MADEASTLMVVVLDTDLSAWGCCGEDHTLAGVLNDLGMYLRAFLLLDRDNQVVVLSHGGRSAPQYTFSRSALVGSSNAQPAQLQAALRGLAQSVQRDAADAVGSAGGEETAPRNTFAAAFSMALCCANRATKDAVANAVPEVRLMVVQAREDDPAQYTAVMNCAFAADARAIPVDVCALMPGGSTSLRQVAHITKGIYLRPALRETGALLQYFLTLFLPDRWARRHLTPPQQEPVDLKAACFCKGCRPRRRVDVGWVCSVCLSVFCERRAICDTCNTKVRVPSVGGRRKKRARSPVARD